MIQPGDIVRLVAPGHRPHGMRHRVVAIETIDLSAAGGMPQTLAVCRCLSDPAIHDAAWPPDRLTPVVTETRRRRTTPVEETDARR